MASLVDYPHILDRIVHHLSWSDLNALYTVSKTVHDKVSSIKFRHVVFYVEDEESTTIRIRDPYQCAPLLVLDRTNMNQFTNHLAKLTTHTTVLDLAGELYILAPWTNLLGNFLATVPVLRALEGSMGILDNFVPDWPEAKMWTKRAGGPQMVVEVRVPEGHTFGDRNFDVERRFVYYGVGLKPHEMLVKFTQHGGDRQGGTPVGQLLSTLRIGDGRYTDLVFIGADELYPPPQANDRNRFAGSFTSAINDSELWIAYRFPERPNIKVKYVSMREYRAQCGLTDEQWDLFTFPPGEGWFPLPQQWC